jgi:hypothetical protein
MITGRDTWSVAKILTDQHGLEAPIYAGMRVDGMFHRGDLDGRDVWRRILKAVKDMLRMPGPQIDDNLAALAEKLIELRADQLDGAGRPDAAIV